MECSFVAAERKNRRQIFSLHSLPQEEIHTLPIESVVRYKIIMIRCSWCKSAGTLLCMAAHRLFIGDLGELGPIDVQRATRDELWEQTSGLTESSAIESLEETAYDMLNHYVFELTDESNGRITLTTAADIATKIIEALLSPISRQIDPMKIGESSRAIKIAHQYGLRLNRESENLKKPEYVGRLVSSYPSHGFVIDRKEAMDIFRRVESPSEDMISICSILGQQAEYSDRAARERPPIIIHISGGEACHEEEDPEEEIPATDEGEEGNSEESSQEDADTKAA